MNDFLIWWTSLLAEHQFLIDTASYVVGGLIAILFVRSSGTLTRAEFFALAGLLLFGVIAFQLQWIALPWMAQNGLAVVTFGADVLSRVLFGFLLGVISQKRSNDAFGHTRAAIMSFLPVLGLWGVIARSRSQDASLPIGGRQKLRGAARVVVGALCCVAAFGLNAFVDSMLLEMAGQ